MSYHYSGVKATSRTRCFILYNWLALNRAEFRYGGLLADIHKVCLRRMPMRALSGAHPVSWPYILAPPSGSMMHLSTGRSSFQSGQFIVTAYATVGEY